MPDPPRLPRHPFRPFSAFRQQAAGMAAATLSPNFREGLLFAVQNFAGFVFRSADSVLSLALHLVSLTLGFVLGIAGHLANAFLDFAFDVGSSAAARFAPSAAGPITAASVWLLGREAARRAPIAIPKP